MDVKINKQWLEENVFKHSANGELWKTVILDHHCIGQYKFDVNVVDSYGKIIEHNYRIMFNDKRLYRNKLYITVPEQYCRFEDVHEAETKLLKQLYDYIQYTTFRKGYETSAICNKIIELANERDICLEDTSAKRLEQLCKKYQLAVFENQVDNLISIISCNDVSGDDKLLAVQFYDDWLLEEN